MSLRTRINNCALISNLVLSRSLSCSCTVYNASDQPLPRSTDKLTRRPTPPAGAKLSQLHKVLFPLSYRESFAQWFHRKSLRKAEEDLLACADIRVSGENANAQSLDVAVGDKLFLNELEVVGEKVGDQENKHVVLIHGYGAAKGFFYKNLLNLAMPGYTLHAIDLLGYGRSSRPTFRIHPTDPRDGVLKAESFFTDSLEEWRKARNIGQFTLLAHSLGAYVGCGYIMRHPERVDKVMMISPAAVGRTVESLPMEVVGTKPDPAIPTLKSFANIPGWFRWGWEHNFSPFSLVRYTGPFGPMMVSGWTYRRFADLSLRERDCLHDYSYSTFKTKGSGEYALNYLLAPGASARWPLAERISSLKVPSLWLYGDHDWMDIEGGHEAARQLQLAKAPPAKVLTVPNAGHHLYLDNPEEFNRLARDFMTDKLSV